ncbi:glycosyltransferase [Candidatus Pelagibacter sp.]|nr:glycosyltransferase [Candidatus Pelagibacter sp.]
MKKKIHIFLRKKNSTSHHSIERFTFSIAKYLKIKNTEIKVIKCPLTSKGIFNRLYLTIWAFFNQGDINHIIGDVHFISLLLNKKRTINTFLDCRLLHEFKGLKFFFYYLFWFKFPILKSSILTFISDFTKKDLKKFSRFRNIENYVIPVPLFRENNNNNNNKKISDTWKILIIGTEKHKNLFNMIKSTKGLKIELHIVGKINIEITNYIRKHRIKIKNYIDVDDNFINKLYFRCDILLMVSYFEGFGMPIIEAQHSKLAVITSKLEPMNTVSGKEAAILVNPKKVVEIKKAINKIINNRNFYKKLIKNGKINSDKYKKIYINKEYKKIYQRLLK